MGTIITPEVSKRNQYYIPKHRYYELKHFCMQYKTWKKILADMNNYPKQILHTDNIKTKDYINHQIEDRETYLNRIAIIDKAVIEADPILGQYVLTGILLNVSYDVLCTRVRVPCCKEVYYKTYRKFFYLLDKSRD